MTTRRLVNILDCADATDVREHGRRLMSSYLREIERARRDIGELVQLVGQLVGPVDLTVTQLAQAIGLAATAHRALLSAMAARGSEQ